jgi:hypothetical protein
MDAVSGTEAVCTEALSASGEFSGRVLAVGFSGGGLMAGCSGTPGFKVPFCTGAGRFGGEPAAERSGIKTLGPAAQEKSKNKKRAITG